MDPSNPYAAPDASLVPATPIEGGVVQPVSQGLRFFNFFIDQVLMQILSSAAGFVLGVVVALSRPDPTQPMPQDELGRLQILGFFLGLVVFVIYFVVMEGLFQRSIAKFLTGTRVVRTDGTKPTFGQIVGRTFARFIPFEPFSFLAGPVGWHDSLSGTRVVKVR